MDILAPIIKMIFNNITQGNFIVEWTTNIIIPLYKIGDISNPSNYHTIMVNPLLGKNFGSMMESRITSWAKEKKDKLVLGQGILQLVIASCLGTSLKKYGAFRVEKPFVALLISKNLLTLFVGISIGKQWKS